MNRELIREVEEQMQIADQLYNDCVRNVTLEELLRSPVGVKKAKAHIMGTIIEQYLKALIRWKGKSWQDIKRLGHGLSGLYKALDDEGKKILLTMLTYKSKSIRSNNNLSGYQGGMKSLDNGRYDGDCAFPEQLDGDDFDFEYFDSLLEKVNIPSLRYSSSDYNLTEKDLTNLFCIARNLHVLSRIARGERSQRSEQKNDSRNGLVKAVNTFDKRSFK